LAQPLHYENYIANPESVMLAVVDTLSLNPLFLRHDLMIEMGRLEMQIEEVRSHTSANDGRVLTPLEQRLARVNEALTRLSA
jgi:hypothetical protein